MTHKGTNTYILGSGKVAVIDPGPAIARHHEAILSALDPGERISHIFVSHAHLDHSGLSRHLAQATGAPVLAFGAADSGRSAAMQRLMTQAPLGGGQGVDHGFLPDILLADAETVVGQDWTLEAIHTPGHMGNHLCFASGNVLFSGDHVMGWSTSLISPPDGDMTDYMAALKKLTQRQWTEFLPGHGAAILQPQRRIADLITHRLDRERALLAALSTGATEIGHLTRMVYTDIPPTLMDAALRNVLAHLIDLEGRNLLTAAPCPGPDAVFSLA